MSLARQFFREFRPLFRMLEEPFGRSPVGPYYGRRGGFDRFGDDPFFASPRGLRPAVDVTEEGDKYIVEAELPGVKKENVEVRIGDGGRSLTIEGKIVNRRSVPQAQSSEASSEANANASAQGSEGMPSCSTALTTSNSPKEISTEREWVGNTTFTRTVWLPRPVNATNVSAKLNDGVLTVTVPKAEDPATVTIPVD
ncbi:HSP20-like chaperone [Panus rudis PR-1116 ss-1]|nr:HSP20-like chaperone [Panus rudis PR-1116 ss-1]